MKKALHLAGTIALLVAMYFLLQVVFIVVCKYVAQGVAAYVGCASKETSYMVHAQAWGLFLSSLTMLLFIHFAGFFRLGKELLHSIAPRTLLISTLLVFSSMFALNIFVQWFQLEDNLSNTFLGLSHNVVGIMGLALLGPLLEEVLFRGAIQGALMRYFGRPWPAIIMSALVFGIFHMNPVQIVYATLLGIVLGWIYYRTGSLLSVIVGHVLNNSLAVVTTVLFGASEEEAIANSTAGIVGFVLFAAMSVYLAVKLEKLKGEN